jgi:hypothetical protein
MAAFDCCVPRGRLERLAAFRDRHPKGRGRGIKRRWEHTSALLMGTNSALVASNHQALSGPPHDQDNPTD